MWPVQHTSIISRVPGQTSGQSEAREQRVSIKLLTRIADHARATGHHAVRLDVIDTNPRARALYERVGFKAKGQTKLGPFARVFGFSSATTMVLEVGERAG